MADLVTDGWLIQDRPDHWVATDQARELQVTSRGRLTRARAQVALTGLTDRVGAVNDDDVAVRLKERGKSKEAQRRLEDASHNRASRHLAAVFDQAVWPRRAVMAL